MEQAPRIIRLKETSPVRYLKHKSFERDSQKFNSQKIKSIIENYNGGYIQLRVPDTSQHVKGALEDYSAKRLNKSIWVISTRKKLEAKNYHHPEDAQAKKRARVFVDRIRQLNLTELPKITYFDEMIRQSCAKEPARRRRHTDLDNSRSAATRLVSLNHRDDPPLDERYQKLRSMLDQYPADPHARTRTHPF